jgi:LPXTG-motif cell wall-anchored protein
MYKKIIWVLISVMIIFVSSMAVFSNSAGSSGYLNAEDYGGCGNNNGGGGNGNENQTDEDQVDEEQNDDPQNSSEDTDQSGGPQENDPADEIENDVTPPTSNEPSEATDNPNMVNADPDTSQESALPKTGEEDNSVGMIIGSSLILLSAGYIIFRKRQVQ